MATYDESFMTDSDIDHKKVGDVLIFRQFRDNLIAYAEQSVDARINRALWHPYDSVLVGDANDGVFWDHSADGAVTSIETPDLADGFDYGLRIDGLSVAGTTPPLTIDGYLATGASWQTIFTTAAHAAPQVAGGFVTVAGPRRANRGWRALWVEPFVNDNGVVLAEDGGSVGVATAQKLTKLRIYAGGTTFDAGTVALYRRRDLLSDY